MKLCQHCKNPLPAGLRADARYCNDQRCRSRAYRERRKAARAVAKPEAPGSQALHPKTSFVVACECGRHLLVQVSPLPATDGSTPAQGPRHVPPELGAAVVSRDSQQVPGLPAPAEALSRHGALQLQASPALTGTWARAGVSRTLEADPNQGEPARHGAPQLAAPADDLSRAVLATDRDGSADPVQEPSDPMPSSSSGVLCTYEVYALCVGRVIPLADALHMGASLKPNAHLVSTHDPSEGFRLAGTPGRWRDFYGERSPADFDLDADKGVLCWNARLARADVLSGKKLHALLGDDWRKIIYR